MPESPRQSVAEAVLSFPVVLGAVLALFVEIVVPRSLGDPDIWWHLRNAQILMTTHHFITQDMFSFTALHAAWMNHEWISELPFYAGWCLGAGRGVFWVTVLEIELVTVAFIFWRTGDRAVRWVRLWWRFWECFFRACRMARGRCWRDGCCCLRSW